MCCVTNLLIGQLHQKGSGIGTEPIPYYWILITGYRLSSDHKERRKSARDSTWADFTVSYMIIFTICFNCFDIHVSVGFLDVSIKTPFCWIEFWTAIIYANKLNFSVNSISMNPTLFSRNKLQMTFTTHIFQASRVIRWFDPLIPI